MGPCVNMSGSVSTPNPGPANASGVRSSHKKCENAAGQNIQVYVRVRPLNGDERNARSSSVVSCPGAREVSVQEKPFSHLTKTFNFDKVFAEDSRQTDVSKVVVHPLIKQVLRGYNCTVFAYGQTGTGKTYTMEGLKDFEGSWADDPDAGIIPRSLVEIFEARDKGGFDKDCFQIKVSFLELYNEEIFDLLCKGMDLDRKYKIFEDSAKKGSVIVHGLEERVVQTKEQVLRILEEGSLKRTTAATKMNASSSRSHTIFTITVTITEKSIVGQEKFIEGKLNLVDLAGSENIGRSGAVDKRAREAGKINESLLTLGRVINSRTKTSIIATISPASINVEETLSTLDYAHRAKNITNRPEVNQKIPVASKLAEMQARVDQIRRELDEQRERDGGVFMSQEKKEELEKKGQELEQLRKEFRELASLFDLKTSENAKLQEDLTDTIKQLEEKSVILYKTQEEKEVQEHLVDRHKDTEEKIKGQAFELREVADQQYSDLDKLHASRERKSELEKQNAKVTSKFQSQSVNRFVRMETLLDERGQTQDKLCNIVTVKQNDVVKMSETFGQDTVEELAKTNDDVKQVMTKVDSLAASHMKSEQEFLSQMLQGTKQKMDRQSSTLQKHLTNTLSVTQEQETSLRRQQSSMDSMIDAFKKHVSMDESLTSSFKDFLAEIMLTTDKKQIECFANAKTVSINNEDTMNALVETLDAKERKMEKDMTQLTDILNANRAEYKAMFEDLRSSINTIRTNVRSAQKEHTESSTIVSGALESIRQRSHAFDNGHEEIGIKTMGHVNDLYQDQLAAFKVVQGGLNRIREDEKTFVAQAQEDEKARYLGMEQELRVRSDEAPQQMQTLQEHTRSVQKLSAESLKALERKTESHQSMIVKWNKEGLSDFDGCCSQIKDYDQKLRNEVLEARHKESLYFTKELQNDRPTGETPGRIERAYPKTIIEGTPDELRIRRYRQTRDLGAAMRLKIDEDDDDDLDTDSVYSASTNVTESDVFHENNSSREISRQNSNVEESMVTNVSRISSGTEEPGYVSDAENKEPGEHKFAHPGSKLKPPKTYPATSAPSVGSRSRSSSRTRKILTQSN
eukprot:TCALIF_06379-PA protein Name:"Similar to kif11 Kinesin-like protein KIF11 (Xenopus tropicalis)" AED:0.16 eAED:0.13 QI:0/0.84/0.64/0.92/0.76/0.85/14/257/1084